MFRKILTIAAGSALALFLALPMSAEAAPAPALQDSVVQQNVLDTLGADASAVSVQIKNGTAYLNGGISDHAAYADIVDRVASTPGVTDVKTGLFILTPNS